RAASRGVDRLGLTRLTTRQWIHRDADPKHLWRDSRSRLRADLRHDAVDSAVGDDGGDRAFQVSPALGVDVIPALARRFGPVSLDALSLQGILKLRQPLWRVAYRVRHHFMLLGEGDQRAGRLADTPFHRMQAVAATG